MAMQEAKGNGDTHCCSELLSGGKCVHPGQIQLCYWITGSGSNCEALTLIMECLSPVWVVLMVEKDGAPVIADPERACNTQASHV